MDAPFDAGIFFGRLGACGQALPCVRPLDAADHTPRALMEMRGSSGVASTLVGSFISALVD